MGLQVIPQAWMEVAQRGMDAADNPRAKILAVFDELGALFAKPNFRGWVHELFFLWAVAKKMVRMVLDSTAFVSE